MYFDFDISFILFLIIRNLINPGDIRSRNNYPQTVQKSPASNIETIDEEDDDDDEEEHVSKLVVIRFSYHFRYSDFF
jgi:hypothetical protein